MIFFLHKKRFAVAAALAFIFLADAMDLLAQTANICLPNDRSFHGYSFINMDILRKEEQVALAPLFMRFDKLYGVYFEITQKANQDDNLAEWSKRFCGEVKVEDLSYVIYKAPASELGQLLTATGSKSLQVPPNLQGNTFAEFVFEKKCTETLEYLLFAKQCEPHVVANDRWQAPPRDKEAMQALIAEGKREFKHTKSAYIRLRYAYQIIRLAHYAGQYEHVLELCDDLLPKVDKKTARWDDSIIPWWIEGHRAGALLKLGKNVEASYAYAQIFEHCPGRRASAYQSFLIKTDEEWMECLRLCQSDGERVTLYAIRAAGAESKALEEMQKIYELDPKSQLLEGLLVQEIRKMERNLLGLEFNDEKERNKRFYKIPRPYAGKYVIDLQRFTRKCREEGQVARPELWYLAEGYLEFLAGDYYAAEQTFQSVESKLSDKTLREQLAIFQIALKIASFEKPSDEAEQYAYDLITDDKRYRLYKSLPDFLKDKMASLFLTNHQPGMAFLSQYPLADLKPNPQIELLDNLIATALKPDQNSFERLLLRENPLYTLLDIKATLLMSTGQFEAAMETYKRMPTESWEDFGQYNPFRETFKDCISCYTKPDSVGLSSYYNKGELLTELLDLDYKSKGDLEGAARYFYQLGLASYNMSYYGFAWKAMDYFRSGSTWARLHKAKAEEGDSRVFDYWKYPFGNRENTGLGRALYFFEKARTLATTPEFGAKAAFQAARCEQKIFFQSVQYKPEPCCNRIPRITSDYQRNFAILKAQFRETEFYQQIIKECKYFAIYAIK
ncbi:MAG: hypothetical protein GC192_23340 [Bacteroidetes bacterium]|nr:hypothetical protein [Bacteroidota bacterium]